MARGELQGDVIAQGKSERLFYLDWLRVFAMASVFLFHADRFFDFDGWHVKSAVLSRISHIHITFFNQWMMPLFFVLSGASIVYALQRRSAGQFIKERFLRLLLPLIALGWFVLAPPQIYLDRLTSGSFSGSFWQFIPVYFQGLDPFGGNFAWHGVHMWFLWVLFLLSVLWLPFMLPRKKSGLSLLVRTAPLFEKPWGLLLLAILVSVMRFGLDVFDMGMLRSTGGWSIFSYLFFLPMGYLLFCTAKTREAVRRFTYPALVLGICFTGLGFIMQYAWQPAIGYLSWQHYAATLMQSLRAVCWIVAFIGLGMRFLNFRNRFVSYANEAVLPFYILHQFVLLLVGYFLVLRWNLPIFLQYVLIVVLSFAAIMLIYEGLVRRIGVLRFLFGMRAKKK
ncbi:acyltransferase family protein [Candidatus Bipolaricaulota bacterium]